ncbi:MAG: hypothetical protein IT329_02560 [Caldilineaceae bacterium]|nr:hypothetical protein [Caldilineaceae bacterium]
MQGILASSSPGESKLRRRRRWLVYLLRAVWFGVAVLVVELMLLAIRPAYARWVTPCTGPPCTGPPCASDLLTPAGLDALIGWGWTPRQYALYNIALAFLVAFFYVGVALLIFRARPNEPVALYSSIGLMLFGVFFSDYIDAARTLGPARCWGIWCWGPRPTATSIRRRNARRCSRLPRASPLACSGWPIWRGESNGVGRVYKIGDDCYGLHISSTRS